MIIVFRIEESHWWVKTLRPQGGCNVLSALKQVIKRKEIDSIVLVLGSWYEYYHHLFLNAAACSHLQEASVNQPNKINKLIK